MLQLTMDEVDQSMWGLRNFSQGRPSTTGDVGEGITKKLINS